MVLEYDCLFYRIFHFLYEIEPIVTKNHFANKKLKLYFSSSHLFDADITSIFWTRRLSKEKYEIQIREHCVGLGVVPSFLCVPSSSILDDVSLRSSHADICQQYMILMCLVPWSDTVGDRGIAIRCMQKHATRPQRSVKLARRIMTIPGQNS